MCYPALFLEGRNDVNDEVVRDGLVAVGEDEVDIVRERFPAAVASNNYTFDAAAVVGRIGPGGIGVLAYRVCNGLGLVSWDIKQELVVIFYADLLHPREAIPAVFDDIVEIAPLACVVEVSGCFGAHAPDVEEVVEGDEVRVFIEFVCSSKDTVFCGLELGKEIGNLVVTAWQGKDL